MAAASLSGSGIRVEGVSPGGSSITVTATDPDKLTAELGFDVVVPDRPPVALGEMPARAVLVGEQARWVVSRYFEELDGQELTYTVASSNAGVAEASLAGDTVFATGRSLGNATITVTATDPGGLEATQEAMVAVVEPAGYSGTTLKQRRAWTIGEIFRRGRPSSRFPKGDS